VIVFANRSTKEVRGKGQCPFWPPRKIERWSSLSR